MKINMCATCIHFGDGCDAPSRIDMEAGTNERYGTSRELGEAIQAWRDNASRFVALRVVDHDESCPGWETEDV